MLIDWLDLHFFLRNKIGFCIARVEYNVVLTRWYIVRLALITRTGIKHNNICLNIVLRFLFIYIENKGFIPYVKQSFRMSPQKKSKPHFLFICPPKKPFSK